MCGRFHLSSTPAEVQKHFNVSASINFNPSYNITPSSYCPVIRLNNNKNEIALCYWGLIPSWAKVTKGAGVI